MDYEAIRYELDGPVATVTLNRPEKLNAYSACMGAELAHAFQQADADDTVRLFDVPPIFSSSQNVSFPAM